MQELSNGVRLYLYNTLSRKKEEFKPIKGDEAGLYTCGPTVYNFAHIGNLRTYIFEDILKRVLLYNGYKVKHVMNITDVGHLTGDMDMGEDKLEAGARREGKTAKEIADSYTKAFKDDLDKLNIKQDNIIWLKATETIPEQIEMIKTLEKKGYTYKTSDGVYFDTAKFKDYTKLSHLNLDTLREGARVEKNSEKRNPTDFALWKFSPKDVKRQQEWGSPWGVGFPGWHLECSVMSMKSLGDQLDIHCGGIDHINVHHTNEIAQSEAATGKKFFNYWLHGAFLNIAGGKKMAKSEGNFLTLENAFIKKGLNPLVFRFACLQTHYRKPMEYSEEVMRNAEQGLNRLYSKVRFYSWYIKINNNDIDKENNKFTDSFIETINNDLNMPQALAISQEVIASTLKSREKLLTLLKFDKIFGLNFKEEIKKGEAEDKVKKMLRKRQKVRDEKNWAESDRLREEIEKLGYTVEDTPEGQRVFKK